MGDDTVIVLLVGVGDDVLWVDRLDVAFLMGMIISSLVLMFRRICSYLASMSVVYAVRD